MKKIVFLMICLFISCLNIKAKSIDVKLNNCIDGDTAKFIYNNEVITARFLAIDTPETKSPSKNVEPFGIEASTYTCARLTNADNIILEFDENSSEKDKYDRYLVWVFVDNKLLQKELISNGYAKVAYLYGDYKYTNELKKEEEIAKNRNLGIWSSYEKKYQINYKRIIILIGILIIVCVFDFKSGKNNLKKVTKK